MLSHYYKKEENTLTTSKCTTDIRVKDEQTREDIIMNKKYSDIRIRIVNSSAGGGKTTLILDRVKQNSKNKYLTLVFNKSIEKDIEKKCKCKKIKNNKVKTIDGYCWNNHDRGSQPQKMVVIINKLVKNKKFLPHINNIIRTYTINSTEKEIKKFDDDDILHIIKELKPNTNDIPLILKLAKNTWSKIRKKNKSLWNYDINRKIAWENNKLASEDVDEIIVDEVQDLNPVMLDMLIKSDKRLLLVGDSKQAIYQFAGNINAFEVIPVKFPGQTSDYIFLELYKTFRIGAPFIDDINTLAKICGLECNMIAGKNISTHYVTLEELNKHKYTYLFRTWSYLLIYLKNVSDNIIIYMDITALKRKLSTLDNARKKLCFRRQVKRGEQEEEEEDYCPACIRNLTDCEWKNFKETVKSKICKKKQASNAKITISTVHSYKGREDDNIRISGDIISRPDKCAFYVAITRCRKRIHINDCDNVDIVREKLIEVYSDKNRNNDK
jgi:TusA-related sulfurtransferase